MVKRKKRRVVKDVILFQATVRLHPPVLPDGVDDDDEAFTVTLESGKTYYFESAEAARECVAKMAEVWAVQFEYEARNRV